MSASKPTSEEVKKSMQQHAMLWRPDHLPQGATAEQLRQHREALRRATEDAQRIKTNCHDCEHFAIGHCKLFDADVPDDFARAEGQCDSWTYDGVPF